jgi:hypothetical protein
MNGPGRLLRQVRRAFVGNPERQWRTGEVGPSSIARGDGSITGRPRQRALRRRQLRDQEESVMLDLQLICRNAE